MPVAGVFVGLSAQFDPRIDALTFGHRDAEALHAHFADANEQRAAGIDELHLLVNENATVASVRAAIASAALAASERRADVVHIHLSCHGSINGDLVLYDANRDETSPDRAYPCKVKVIEQLAAIGKHATSRAVARLLFRGDGTRYGGVAKSRGVRRSHAANDRRESLCGLGR